MSIKDGFYYAELYTEYKKMLTENQRSVFEMYCMCDLSLGEIAEIKGVSRQSVLDSVSKTKKILEDLESKLSILSKKKGLSEQEIMAELEKSSHRSFTTGFVVDDGAVRQNLETSHQVQTSEFKATVLDSRKVGGKTQILVEMRNRFQTGDTLEVLSPSDAHNMKVRVVRMEDEDGAEVVDARRVQQKLWLELDCEDPQLLNHISALDVLRK